MSFSWFFLGGFLRTAVGCAVLWRVCVCICAVESACGVRVLAACIWVRQMADAEELAAAAVPGLFSVQDGQLVVGEARQHEDKLERVTGAYYLMLPTVCCLIMMCTCSCCWRVHVRGGCGGGWRWCVLWSCALQCLSDG
jgi:hypothetical protein